MWWFLGVADSQTMELVSAAAAVSVMNRKAMKTLMDMTAVLLWKRMDSSMPRQDS